MQFAAVLALWLIGAPEDTIALRDRFRPMGARQNLVLYYNDKYSVTGHISPDDKQRALDATVLM